MKEYVKTNRQTLLPLLIAAVVFTAVTIFAVAFNDVGPAALL